MNALNNANIQDVTCKGLVPFAFPVAKNTQSGESVEYVRDANKKWFVLRILYNQIINIANFMISDGVYAYVAMVWKVENEDGKKHKKLVPFLNLLFAYLTDEEAEAYVKGRTHSRYITYYYNHFAKDGGYNPPLVVKERDIEKVIRATSFHDEHVMNVDLKTCNFVSNELVRVTDGPFEGIVGRVARIARQKRVVITIEGIDTGISTAYIPPYCLERVTEQ